MICKTCGAELDDTARFCENCGTKIEHEAAPAVEEVKEEAVQEAEETLERVEAEVVGDDAPKMEADKEEKTTSGPYVSNSFNESSANFTAPEKDPNAGPIGYSIASLVCGILGILCCCCSWLGIACAIAGIVLGIISINKNCEGKGMAIAGIVCGGVGAFIGLIALVFGATASKTLPSNFNADQIQNFLDEIGEM